MSEAATMEFAPAIKDLAEKIVNLTVRDAQSLVDCLKNNHGIEPAGGGVVMAAAAGGGEAAAKAEEKTAFDVVLEAFGDNKIGVIKVVRAVTGLGLKEAKDLVEGAPKPLKQGIAKEEAEKIKKELTEAGATVSIK